MYFHVIPEQVPPEQSGRFVPALQISPIFAANLSIALQTPVSSMPSPVIPLSPEERDWLYSCPVAALRMSSAQQESFAERLVKQVFISIISGVTAHAIVSGFVSSRSVERQVSATEYEELIAEPKADSITTLDHEIFEVTQQEIIEANAEIEEYAIETATPIAQRADHSLRAVAATKPSQINVSELMTLREKLQSQLKDHIKDTLKKNMSNRMINTARKAVPIIQKQAKNLARVEGDMTKKMLRQVAKEAKTNHMQQARIKAKFIPALVGAAIDFTYVSVTGNPSDIAGNLVTTGQEIGNSLAIAGAVEGAARGVSLAGHAVGMVAQKFATSEACIIETLSNSIAQIAPPAAGVIRTYGASFIGIINELIFPPETGPEPPPGLSRSP